MFREIAPLLARIHTFHEKSMKLNENQWKSTKIDENQWKSMKSNEKQWKPMKINENQWKAMKIIENQKKSMETNGAVHASRGAMHVGSRGGRP